MLTSRDQKPERDIGFGCHIQDVLFGTSFICHFCSLGMFSLFHDSIYENDAGNKANWYFLFFQ